jgi:uncharacterized repeat protein (TIGR02543 family)
LKEGLRVVSLPGSDEKLRIMINNHQASSCKLKEVIGMSIKRGFQVLLAFLLVMFVTSLFTIPALAATVDDVGSNSLRVGADVYDLSADHYTYDKVLDSLRYGGSHYYFKFGDYWYDLLDDEKINTLEDLQDPSKAVPSDEVLAWNLRIWYSGPEVDWEYFEPIYRVGHYQQNVTGDGYTKYETTICNGPIDTTVTATANVYAGFTLNEDMSTMSGDIKPDGSLVLKLYYDRDTFEVSFESNGGSDVDAITGVRYEATIAAPTAPTKTGYTFAAWFKDEALSSEWAFETDRITSETILYAQWTANEYMVTFDAQGGTPEPAVRQVTYDGTYGELPEVAKTGYTFQGWFTEAAGGNKIEAATKVKITEGITLYAQWTANSYEVSFDAQGGTPSPDSISVTYDEEYGTLPVVTKTGYTFQGWFTEAAGGNKIEAATKVKITEGITLYAQWTANSYDVSFDAQGGTPSPDSISVTYDEEYGTLPVVTKTGYTFQGWFTEVAGGTEVKATTVVETDQDHTLYAQWTANSYDVSFDAQGGTPSPDSISVTYDEEYGTLPVVTKTGYTFQGWFTAKTEGEKVTAETTVKTAAAHTLYAQWTINQYTITFDTAGGTPVPSITQDYGTDVTAPVAPTKTGYTFKGWDKDIPETMPAENITITAQWTAVVYDITYHLDGGINDVDNPATYTIESETITLKAATKTGYTFDGWYDAAEGGNKVEAITKGTTGAKNLYAYWTANKYNVTFDAQGGTPEPAVRQMTYDGTYGELPEVAKTGYTFQGWFTAKTEGEKVTAETTVKTAAAHTLYAQWTINQYTITFDTAGGTPVPSITQDYGTDVTAPVAPTKTGYTFKGWDKDIPETMPAENITITAQWTAVVYDITYHLDGGINDVDNPATYTIESETITLKAATKTGYTFDGWYDAAEGGNKVETITKGTTGAKNLYAYWTANKYNVTFDAQGGTPEPAVRQVTYDGTYGELPEVAKTGYTFQGWFTAKTEGDEVTAETDVKTAENHTLYAQWKINQYTINATANPTDYGTVTGSGIYIYGNSVVVTAQEEVGYWFDNWTENGEEVSDEREYTFTATADRELVANFIPINYWTFEIIKDLRMAEFSIGLLDEATQPKATHFELRIEGEGTQLRRPVENCFRELPILLTEDPANIEVRLYSSAEAEMPFAIACCKGEPGDTYGKLVIPEYTVSFETNGGSEVDDLEGVYNGATITEPVEPTKTGYTFEGWYRDEDLTEEWNFETDQVMEDTTLYAGWIANKYMVTFNAQGGTPTPESKQVTYDGTYGDLATVMRTGYAFQGWFMTESGDDEVITTTIVETAQNHTLFAHWVAVDYDITYHLDGGINDVDNPATYTIESETITLKAATKTGYTFDGWYDAAEDGNKVETITKGTTGAKNLYAYWTANKYNVTFDAQGGTPEPAVRQVTYDGTYGELPEVAKTGYTFQGWFTAKTEGEKVTAETIVKTAENHTLYAQWKINQYTITFVTDGGTVIAPITADYGADVTAPDNPTRTGYTFDSWDKDIPETMPAENITITAQWTANEYSITYHLDGGTNDEANPAKYTIETDTITLKEATKTGYTFDGWYDAAEGGNRVETITKGSTGDITLYAYWTAKQYTVTFDAREGTVEPSSYEVTYDAAYGTLPTPTKTGHDFKGWFTEQSGGIEVTAGTKVTTADDHTLYARWEINTYTVTFSAGDNGSITAKIGDVAITSGTNVEHFKEVVFTAGPATGYKVKEWKVNSQVVEGAVGSTYTITSLEDAVTVTVEFEKITYTLTYTVGANGSITGVSPQSVKYGENGSEVEAVPDTGYHFVKWSDGAIDAKRTDTGVTGDISVEAEFAITSYTITYNLDDGENHEGNPATFTIETETITLKNATKTGYTFGGWYDAETGGNQVFQITTGSTGAKTLYARWTANEYTVTFDANGGDIPSPASMQVTYDGTYVSLPIVTQTGYTFDGWFTAKTGGNKVEATDKVEITGDATLYAHWTANKYTVTFDACGGTPTPESMPVTYDGTYGSLPVVTQTGYTFEGWFTEETGGSRIESSTTVKITGNITLYAHWEPTPARNVELLIEELPVVAGLTLADLDAVEAAEAAYKSLSTEDQGQVSPAYVNNLNSAVAKITQLVFENLDARFENAKGQLFYENTGIQGIEYENHKATFFIDNPDNAVQDFLGSGVVQLFDAMFRDVVQVKLGDDETWYEVEEGSMGAIGAAARLVSAMLDIPFTPPFGDVSKLAAAKLSELQGKDIALSLKIKPGLKDYIGDYVVEFKGIDCTVTINAVGGEVSGGGTYEIGTEVVIRITPPVGKEIDTFSVDGDNKKDDLVDGTYTFTIKSDVTVKATYAWKKYTVTFVDWDNSVLSTQSVQHGRAAPSPANPVREGHTFSGWDVPLINITQDLTVTATYTINQYTITFETGGGTEIGPITADYGTEVTAPDAPTKTGYTFAGWFKEAALTNAWNFASDKVEAATTLYAKWTPNTDTSYKVEHYQQDVTGTGYTLKDTDNLTGTTDALVTATAKVYTGFTENTDHESRVASGKIKPDGTLVLKLFYDRDTFEVGFESNGGSDVDPITGVRYEATIAAPTAPTKTGYTFAGWFKEAALNNAWNFASDKVEAATTLYAKWTLDVYTITYELDGGANDPSNPSSYTYETADITLEPAAKGGYRFDGWWDSASGGNQVTSIFRGTTGNKTLYARYTYSTLVDLKDLYDASTDRSRPGYTDSIDEWDTYWNQFRAALTNTGQVYATFKEITSLTPEDKATIQNALETLQRNVEILDGIEDFDAALGGREYPLGLVETVYNRSLISDSFQFGRLRCFYDKEGSYLYWLMSEFLQGQGYYAGTTGTGMNPGLQNVMASESLVRLKSGTQAVEIFHPDGRRKTSKELEDEGINLAFYWLFNCGLWKTGCYVDLVDFVIDCKLVGKTSDETEFARTYTFHFADAGVYLFEKYFRYCVVDGAIQRDFGDYNVINVTQDLKYTEGTIQTAINEANSGDEIYVGAGTFNESLTIDKSITLFGSHYATGSGQYHTVLDGQGLNSVPGIQIAAGVSDVTITGFEIRNFDTGGIVAQGAGINNVAIARNYIHDVQTHGIRGGVDGAQTLSGWSVTDNTIEKFAGKGISLGNVVDSSIERNKISNPDSGSAVAIDVAGCTDSGTVTVSGVTIAGNEVTGDDVRVTATGTGSGAATTQNITVSGNTVTGGAIVALADAEDSSIATVKGITINGNTISGDTAGIDLGKKGSGTAVLQNFIISGNNLAINDPMATGYAVDLADVGGESTFTNNNVVIAGTAGSGIVFDGIGISGGATGKWAISNSQLDGGGVGSASSGIRLGSSLPGTAQLNMTRTKVTGWAQGIKSDTLASGAKVEIRQSWIQNNTLYGIQNGSGAVIDAILNYWGHTSGPKHTATNPGGQGNEVSNNVNYNPWHQDEEFVSLSNGTVYNETQAKYYQSIQTAIDEAAVGDTILVAQGIYHEDVLVTKSVTLRGDCGDLNEAGPGPNAPILDGSNLPNPFTRCGFQIRCDGNVVIEGFEIRNYDQQGLDTYGGCNNIIFRYNHVHDVGQSGVRAFNNSGVSYGWEVTHNKIERVATGSFGGDGVNYLNISQSEISNNVINVDSSPYGTVGIRTAAKRNVGESPVENILISNNTITGSANPLGFGSDDSPDISALRDITIVDNVINTSGGVVGEGMAQISGTAVFSGNRVETTGNDIGLQFWFWKYRTVEWTIEDNYLDGKSGGAAGTGMWFWGDASLTLHMNGNTVTGWQYGLLFSTTYTEIVLRSNRFYDNDYAVWGSENYVDAVLNYWGDESGPWHETLNLEGTGNNIGRLIDFDPWYIDFDCTTTNDQEAMNQADVGAALAKVPATIASVEVPGGTGAGDAAKRAAVKAYLENLEGMAALGVTITIDAGSSSGYKVSITKGDAIGIKDNIQVSKFAIPPADSEAAGIVNDLITALPSAANVDLDNYLTHLAAIEGAEAAFNALTEPQKAILGALTVDKLENLVIKAQELVLEELDGRIESAIDELYLAGTGINKVGFDDREATLFVSDPDKKVYEFVQSGVVSLFESMFQDVVAMRLGEDPDWYGVEGTSAGATEAGAHIVSVLLGFPYEYEEDFGGVFSQLAAADLGDLLDKSLSIEVKIQRLEDGKEYLGTYVIGFVSAE